MHACSAGFPPILQKIGTGHSREIRTALVAGHMLTGIALRRKMYQANPAAM